MLSQGLGPRQSVLPLLISFLFSHIVLAKHSFPLRRSPHILLLPPFFSFLHPFRSSSFSPISPSYLFSRSLFISRSMPYLAPWESARAIRVARKEVLIPVSRHDTSLLSHLRSIRATTWLRPHLLILLSYALLSYQWNQCNTWVWSSHSRIKRNFVITYYYYLRIEETIDRSFGASTKKYWMIEKIITIVGFIIIIVTQRITINYKYYWAGTHVNQLWFCIFIGENRVISAHKERCLNFVFRIPPEIFHIE